MMHSRSAFWRMASSVSGDIVPFTMPFSRRPVGQLGHFKLHPPRRSILRRYGCLKNFMMESTGLANNIIESPTFCDLYLTMKILVIKVLHNGHFYSCVSGLQGGIRAQNNY